jgi:hypothetical protein
MSTPKAGVLPIPVGLDPDHLECFLALREIRAICRDAGIREFVPEGANILRGRSTVEMVRELAAQATRRTTP